MKSGKERPACPGKLRPSALSRSRLRTHRCRPWTIVEGPGTDPALSFTTSRTLPNRWVNAESPYRPIRSMSSRLSVEDTKPDAPLTALSSHLSSGFVVRSGNFTLNTSSSPTREIPASVLRRVRSGEARQTSSSTRRAPLASSSELEYFRLPSIGAEDRLPGFRVPPTPSLPLACTHRRGLAMTRSANLGH